MRTLPADQQWATDPREAAAATIDQIHKLLLTTVAHQYQIEVEMDAAEDMEEYKMLTAEHFRIKSTQTVLMALLKSPVA